MINCDLYAKYDYFRNKTTNIGLKQLFKIDEFINSHCNYEKTFYENLVETQKMFCDFICKKMIFSKK